MTRNTLQTSVSGFWVLPLLADGIEENVDFHTPIVMAVVLQIGGLYSGQWHFYEVLPYLSPAPGGINPSFSINLVLIRSMPLHGLIHLSVSSSVSFGAKIRLNLST